jgi:hypothetical protein
MSVRNISIYRIGYGAAVFVYSIWFLLHIYLGAESRRLEWDMHVSELGGGLQERFEEASPPPPPGSAVLLHLLWRSGLVLLGAASLASFHAIQGSSPGYADDACCHPEGSGDVELGSGRLSPAGADVAPGDVSSKKTCSDAATTAVSEACSTPEARK